MKKRSFLLAGILVSMGVLNLPLAHTAPVTDITIDRVPVSDINIHYPTPPDIKANTTEDNQATAPSFHVCNQSLSAIFFTIPSIDFQRYIPPKGDKSFSVDNAKADSNLDFEITDYNGRLLVSSAMMRSWSASSSSSFSVSASASDELKGIQERNSMQYSAPPPDPEPCYLENTPQKVRGYW